MNVKKAPSGRELPTKSGEGERVTIIFIKTFKLRRLLPSRFACHLPLGGRLFFLPLSPAEELKKMKELLDMGIITQEEFDSKKKQLLGL